MAPRGGGRAGRGNNVDDGFDREDAARTWHLIEDRMARMEDQFEAFTEQMTQRFDALMAAVPNQRRNRSPNLRRAWEDGVDDVEEGFDNPFRGYGQRQSEFNPVVFPMLHYKPMMHMDGRPRRDRNRNEVVAELEELIQNQNTSSLQPQVDWSLPPIFDEYVEDGSLIVVDMDACHLLLGRPWEFDVSAMHDGRKNTYSFTFENSKIVLLPSREILPKTPLKESPSLLTLLTKQQVVEEIVEKSNANAYRLKLPSHIRTTDVFNVKHLIPYRGDNSDDEAVGSMNSGSNSFQPGEDDADGIAITFLERWDPRKKKIKLN